MARWLAPSAGLAGVGWALVTAVPHATLGSALVMGVVGCLPLGLTITLIRHADHRVGAGGGVVARSDPARGGGRGPRSAAQCADSPTIPTVEHPHDTTHESFDDKIG